MQLLYIFYIVVVMNCRVVLICGQEQREENGAVTGNGEATVSGKLDGDFPITSTITSDAEESTLVPTEILDAANNSLANSTGNNDFDEYEEESNASMTPLTPSSPDEDVTEEPPSGQPPDDSIAERGFMVEDFCLCDLKVSICDINCCCDGDCDAEDKKIFSHCQERPQPVLDSRYCFQEHIIFSNHTEYSVSFTHPGVFCIATDNFMLRTTYTSVKGATTIDEFQSLQREKRRSYSWAPQEKASSISLEPYIDGTNIWALDRNGTSFPVGIPSSVVGSECETTTPVLFLHDATSKCIRVFQTLVLDCVANSYLDAHSYLAFSFIADPSRLFQNASKEATTESDASVSATTAETTSNESTDVTATTPVYESTLTPANMTTGEPDVVSKKEPQRIVLSSPGEIIEALSNFSDLYPDDVVSVSPYICHIMADGDEECSDRPVTVVPRVSYKNGTCSNAIISIKYIFQHNGSQGILYVKAKVYLANLTEAQRQVIQGFEVKFEWLSSDKQETLLERSGRPGYVQGKPLLMGKLIENRTEEDVLKEAIQLSTDPNHWLKILAPGKEGRCDSSSQVTFGIDVGGGCLLEVSQRDFDRDCSVLQEKILSKLLGPIPLNDALLRIASFGDSSINNPADWVPILMTEEVQCGTLSQLYGTGQFFSLVTSLHVEIAFSLQGSLANPQAKVVGVNIRYGEPLEVYPPCMHNACYSRSVSLTGYVELKASVSFVDVTLPPLPAYSQPPALDVKLPYDFFYPFLPSASAVRSLNNVAFILSSVLYLVMNKAF
ncbi:tectonic-3-like [Macrobrachium nipponense]|uniref:tectonic-3-like n=1 Tax=Macrobrachium nipponense TaxID=159736 RepID=UPI0030C7B245